MPSARERVNILLVESGLTSGGGLADDVRAVARGLGVDFSTVKATIEACEVELLGVAAEDPAPASVGRSPRAPRAPRRAAAGVPLDVGACEFCGSSDAPKKCACGGPSYCNRECQKAAWSQHKKTCGARPKNARAHRCIACRGPFAPSIEDYGVCAAGHKLCQPCVMQGLRHWLDTGSNRLPHVGYTCPVCAQNVLVEEATLDERGVISFGAYGEHCGLRNLMVHTRTISARVPGACTGAAGGTCLHADCVNRLDILVRHLPCDTEARCRTCVGSRIEVLLADTMQHLVNNNYDPRADAAARVAAEN